MSEQDERLAMRGMRGMRGEQGQQGDRGEQGTAGAPGLSRAVRRALVFLFALNLLLAAANFLWTAHSVNSNGQQRCASVEADATIPVPQPVAGNPSRLWESRFEANARKRARQLGCEGN